MKENITFVPYGPHQLDPHYLIDLAHLDLQLLEVPITTSFSIPVILPTVLARTYCWFRLHSSYSHIFSFLSIPNGVQRHLLDDYLHHKDQHSGRLTQETQLYVNIPCGKSPSSCGTMVFGTLPTAVFLCA